MRLQTDDRQKNTKGVREGMSEHNTEEPEMIVIDIEEIKNKLLEAGRSLMRMMRMRIHSLMLNDSWILMMMISIAERRYSAQRMRERTLTAVSLDAKNW